MPYAEGLPFADALTPQSRHTSRAGAKAAASREPSQTVRYLEAIKTYGGLTDLEAAQLLQLDRSSINARRAPLVKAGIVKPNGFRKSPSGIKNVVWSISA